MGPNNWALPEGDLAGSFSKKDDEMELSNSDRKILEMTNSIADLQIKYHEAIRVENEANIMVFDLKFERLKIENELACLKQGLLFLVDAKADEKTGKVPPYPELEPESSLAPVVEKRGYEFL